MSPKLNLVAALIFALLACCSSRKDQSTTADFTERRADSASQNAASSKFFIQDTPEAKYSDSLYLRFLKDNPTYYKEYPLNGTFLRTEVVSNQLVDLERSPGVRVLQAVCVFNHGEFNVHGIAGLYARLLILEVMDREVGLLASTDVELPNSSASLDVKTISFINFRVTPNNDAIGIVREFQRHANGLDEQKNELTMFIVMENKLTEVFKTTLKDSRNSYASGADYHPDNDLSLEVELKVFGAETMGLFDLLESTESKGVSRATSTTVRTLRWNGSRYE